MTDEDPHELIPLARVASWERPTLSSILTAPDQQACALVCKRCAKDKRAARYAVEFQPALEGLPGLNCVYHKIENLKSF
jgi:hypothetical protein